MRAQPKDGMLVFEPQLETVEEKMDTMSARFDQKRAPRMKWIGLLVVAAIGLVGCSSGRVAPPDVVDTWQPPAGTDAAAPVSCEENRSLFAYDAQAPLDIQEVSRSRGEGTTVIDLTYASPMGGRVPATLVVPDGSGPFAGLLFQHGMGDSSTPGIRRMLLPMAEGYARLGALVILIDAPFARPEHRGSASIVLAEQDRREQIQLIVDLRRAVDLLLSRSEVDPQRLAYVGISYGGAMGGLLAGVEDRLQGYVLMVGDGGLVTHVTGPEDTAWWLAKPEELRRQWLAWMWPIEPIHYVHCAAPAALLFQNGTLDMSVPPADALRYQQAGSEPKTVQWYQAGHGLRWEALRDQVEWLRDAIGLARYQAFPRSVRVVLIAWFLLTVGSLAFLALDLWRTRPAPRGARLLWLLTTLFLGPLGLAAYWISGRQPGDAGESAEPMSPARRALGSAAWAAAGNLIGAIVALGLLLYFPQVFGSSLVSQIATILLLSLSMGWLTFAASRWISWSDVRYVISFRRPVHVLSEAEGFAEVVSTCLVLTGAYPTFTVLEARYLARWTNPFGFDLFYPPLWGVLCLAALAGTLVAYPFHLWMMRAGTPVRRGVLRWGGAAMSGEAAAKSPEVAQQKE